MEHLNEATFPSNNPNTLMTPYLYATEEHHKPGPLTLAILEDIGWNVNYDVGFENLGSDLDMVIFPNPVDDYAFLRLNQSVKNEPLELIDVYGRVVASTRITTEKGEYYALQTAQLAAGLYTVRLRNGLFKLIKQ
jgi:hypothetical protein